jgi:hypothetical protein
MPKENINKILKQDASKKVKVIDYSSDAKRDDLTKLKEKRDDVLKNKEVDWQQMGSFIIKK